MNDFVVDAGTKVTLYLKECYGCDRWNKYGPLHDFLNDHKIGIYNGHNGVLENNGLFMVKRIELNPKWQQEAAALEVDLPALLFEHPNGEREAITYNEFIRKLNEQKESAKPAKAGSRVGNESPTAPSSKKKGKRNGDRKKAVNTIGEGRRKTEAKGKGKKAEI